MRFRVHQLISLVVLLPLYYGLHVLFGVPVEWFYFTFFPIVFVAMLPDNFEPAKHWTHRKGWHSKRALKWSSIGAIVTWFLGVGIYYIVQPWDQLSLFSMISAAFATYAVHLIADSFTKVGLPD